MSESTPSAKGGTIDTERLYDLLLGLFRNEVELERFLVLLGYPVEQLVPVTKRPTLSYVAQQVARGLVERDLADERFFDALRKRSPERARDVDLVAGSMAGSPPEGSAPEPTPAQEAEPAEPLSAESALFLESLAASVDGLSAADPVAPALDPRCWPWTGAVAVLGAFRPSPLPVTSPVEAPQPPLQPLPGPPPADPAPAALAGFVRTLSDGHWVLRDDVRTSCLRKLHDDGSLRPALVVNAALADPRRDALRLLTGPDEVRLSTLDLDQLNDLDVVYGWLDAIDAPPWLDRAAVHAAAERRRLIDPLRRLVGQHFHGRERQLSALRRHLSTASATDAVVRLHGPGGVGKSSLIGRLLLDLEDHFGAEPRPFAYLDFDRAVHDPRNPRGLVEQIARQLRLLYANSAEAAHLTAVESASAGTDAATVAELLDLGPGLDLDALVAVLAERLRELWSSSGPANSAPLVLVLDTFEEVQAKGPGPVSDVLALVERIQVALPGTRVIIAGRSLHRMDGPGRLLVLGDLDRKAALAVLEQRGVTDAHVRTLILDRFGRNPLTLKLAAEALARFSTAEAAFAGVVAEANALAEVALEQIQGMLYSRILGHLHDPDVIRIAHPGLAVRLVTVEVLSEVLAEPCGLDPSRAEEIFDRLRREVSMFELLADGSLQHRQDVRQLMLRMMAEDPQLAPRVAEIHRRAAVFYGQRRGAEARAEELYHRLSSGEDPRGLNALWRRAEPAGRPPSVDEPLPKRSRLWLERRLGLVPDTDRADLDQEEWEADAALRAASWLTSGAPVEALAVLRERPARLTGSRLLPLDLAALTANGELTAADRLLDQAMTSALHDRDLAAQLDLTEQAVVLRARQGDPAGVAEAARAAGTLADLTAERIRGVDILVRAVTKLQDAGHADEAATLGHELARRFGALDGPTLRAVPELVRRVLTCVGATEPGVVLHAAQHTGDTDAVFGPDTYSLARLLDATSPAATAELQGLAQAVGSKPWGGGRGDTLDLASRVVRLGRIGEAIQIGMNYATDADIAGSLVANELVHRIGPEVNGGIPLPGRHFA